MSIQRRSLKDSYHLSSLNLTFRDIRELISLETNCLMIDLTLSKFLFHCYFDTEMGYEMESLVFLSDYINVDLKLT
jgi:hypothetical protein